MNLSTWVTLSRLFVLPFMFYWLQTPTPQNRWWSLVFFLIGALTDWLDGYLARRLDQVTEFGKVLDPLVDKLLVLGTLIALVELRQVPAWGVFLILTRELMIAGWRVNPQLKKSSVIMGANQWGKLKTVVQLLAIALLLAPLPELKLVAAVTFWFSVALTWISGLMYLWGQEA